MMTEVYLIIKFMNSASCLCIDLFISVNRALTCCAYLNTWGWVQLVKLVKF